MRFDEIKLYILVEHVYLTFLIKHLAFDCDSVLPPSSGNLNASLTYNGQCYVFFRERLDWLHARDKCKQLNGSFDLLSILGEEEMSFVTEYMKLISAKRTWTGLNDIDEEMTFKWADGSVFNYGSQFEQYPWRKLAPDNVSYAHGNSIHSVVNI